MNVAPCLAVRFRGPLADCRPLVSSSVTRLAEDSLYSAFSLKADNNFTYFAVSEKNDRILARTVERGEEKRETRYEITNCVLTNKSGVTKTCSYSRHKISSLRSKPE